MKAITIHGIDDDLAYLISKRVQEESLSQNKTVKKILAEALGMTKQKKYHDFSEFCGVWDKKDHEEFNKNTKQFKEVDELEWK